MSTDFKPSGNVTLNKTFNQLGILVLDGSGSMSDVSTGNASKAKHVESACIEMFNRFNVSRKKQNFSFACIKFDNTPTVTLEPTSFDYDALMNANFDPLEDKGGQTYINLALEKAKDVAEIYLNNPPEPGIPHKVLIMLMSDGMCFEPQMTLAIAAEIKNNPDIEIASVYYSKVGSSDIDAQGLLKEVASDYAKFITVYDGDALRNFFVNSLSASAGIPKSDIS